MPRLRRILVVGLLAASMLAGGGAAAQAKEAAPKTSKPRPCPTKLLVLSAMPVELDPLIAELDLQRTVEINDRRFFVGRLRGNRVILAITGIGLLNATQTTEDAFAHFRCGKQSAIGGVVFSGVAGGDWIGDVAVPTRWTDDLGETFFPVDEGMLAVAHQVAAPGAVTLTQDVHVGDPACVCKDVPELTTVTATRIEHVPQVVVGGDGTTSDPFNGRRLPCFPAGGDVFGCDPCKMPREDPPDAAAFATGIAPFLDPGFFTGYFEAPPEADPAYKAQDMESGAVARVAAAKGKPFIAFRGVSDGQGDPLMLPGFPFQFFAYRTISAENAAVATLGFLDRWAQR
jgi:nucleoside phosphorylase